MKIYLAARYTAKDEVKDLADKLETLGHVVTSSWCRRDDNDPQLKFHREVVESGNVVDTARQYAEEDYNDVMSADVLCFLTYLGRSSRGGMHVEHGMALGSRIPTILVGPRINVFDTLHYFEIDSVDKLPKLLEICAS